MVDEGDAKDAGAAIEPVVERAPAPGVPEGLAVGSLVAGRIAALGAAEILVDLDGGSGGTISREEFVRPDGSCPVGVGDQVEAVVLSTAAGGASIRLSTLAVSAVRGRSALEAARKRRTAVDGRVGGVVKGGFEVEVEGLRAFCPTAHMDLLPVDDPLVFLGRGFSFAVLEVGGEGRRIVVSRRPILEAEARRRVAELRGRLVPGAELEGTVTSVPEFGAFVDLGGVEGLIHVSEISHERVERADDVLAPGQVVRVRVLAVDRRTRKVSLSRKALLEDPWTTVKSRLRERQVVDGRLVRETEFGAFVEIFPGVEGLLHASELPRKAMDRLREAVRVRAAVSVVVLSIDAKAKRIALAPAPGGVEPGAEIVPLRARVGDIVTGRVEEIQPFGVVVRFGPGQTGVVPKPETGVPRGDDLSHAFPVGGEVTAEVTAVERGGRRLRLSVARAVRREERAELERYGASQGTTVLSTLGELLQKARDRRG